jgi:DNA-binding NtrC family response regulator
MTTTTAPAAKILVLDDNQELLSVLQRILSEYQQEFAVDYASCPRKALELLKTKGYWLVIADEDLGQDLPGHVFLKHAKVFSPKSERMMLTGYGKHAELQSLARSMGVLQIVAKPFDKEDLLKKIRNGLGAYKLKNQ